MTRLEKTKPARKPIARRRRLSADTSQWVRSRPLFEDGSSLPLLVEPALPGIDLVHWAAQHAERIQDDLLRHGGILFRDLDVLDPAMLERLVNAVSGSPLDYSYRSTPRKEVEGRVYTSTEYPPDQVIPMHNEMSYTRSWPLKIWFLCVTPASSRGETPIADSREVYRRIDPSIRRSFEERDVLYVRNYGGGLDLPWQEVFQTDREDQVEDFCTRAGIEWEWWGRDRLRTRQVCQAVADHPETGERVWFNQAHLFHVSSLPEETRRSLLAVSELDDLPRNTYYGDGAPIEDEALDAIRAAYEEAQVLFPWRAGDVLLLDNMLTAHGRSPYEGERRVVVAMSEPMDAPRSPETAGSVAP